jgi:non-ribosomal peptide synthetase component E (peptide arylation enzyme)
MLCEIRDRLKDVITKCGENISLVEVETLLLKHLAVQEVMIVGLADHSWGSGRFPASISRCWHRRFLRIRRSPRPGIDLERPKLGGHVGASFR